MVMWVVGDVAGVRRQIYDTADTEKFEEGKAIIAYCEVKGCNKGALGNNEGGEESTSHVGMSIGYSGYVLSLRACLRACLRTCVYSCVSVWLQCVSWFFSVGRGSFSARWHRRF